MGFKTADKRLIREINKSTILKIIREKGPISRADIAKLIGLNPATVTNNVNLLLESGIVVEKGSGDSSGGRKPILLELDACASYVIGVDMGMSKVVTAIINLKGEIIKRVYTFFDNHIEADSVISAMKKSIYKIIEEAKIKVESIIGIGMGVHGIVDPEKGVSVFAPGFNWRNVNIRNIMEDEFKMPVFIDNDARVMALGEKWFGAARDVDNFALINVGSGIGSGIMIKGELYNGTCSGAGEIGHISIVDNGPKCNCGNYGCLEVMASGPALAKRVISRINMGEDTIIADLIHDDLSKVTGEVIYEAAKLGDRLALEALSETGRYIGYAISNLINILNPEMIVVGGGVAMAGEYVFKSLLDVAEKKSMDHLFEKVRIVPAALNENCGVIGAATLVLKDLFNSQRI